MPQFFPVLRAQASSARVLSLGVALAAVCAALTPVSAADPSGAPGMSAAERDLIERARREGRAPLESQRTEELDKLSDKLRRAREALAEKGQKPNPWTTDVRPEAPAAGLDRAQRQALGAGRDVIAARDTGRATILIVMTPGTRGIRRFDAAADPVICTDDGCFVSQGANFPAEMRGRGGVLGVQNTFGARAGACRSQLGCVFRDVEIGLGSKLVAPVDLRVVKHDHRASTVVAIDESCKVSLERVVCNRPFVGDGYTLWVVPEAVAREAGSERLQRAVDAGLRR